MGNWRTRWNTGVKRVMSMGYGHFAVSKPAVCCRTFGSFGTSTATTDAHEVARVSRE
jgi:hypothetical protein